MLLRLSSLCAASLLVLGCSSDAPNTDGGGGSGGGDCGPKPAEDDGPCPAPWECVDGEWIQSDVVCEDPTCGSEPPSGPCDHPGYVCAYGPDAETCADGEVYALCNIEWSVECSVEPPCGPSAPDHGEACGALERTCVYDLDCGTFVIDRVATCEGGSWSVDEPSCMTCFMHETPAACAADAACVWVEPGCDAELPAIQSGCRVNWQCGGGESCPAQDLTCKAFSSDPCWDAGCEECHEPFFLCVGPEGP